MLLSDAEAAFLHDKELYAAPATVEYYKNSLHKWDLFRFSCSLEDVSSVNRDILKLYLSFLRDSGVKNTSIHTYFRALKNFFRWCFDENLLAPFPVNIKLPRPDPEAEKCFLYLSGTDENNRNLLLFRLLLDCGFRLSEALNLKFSDIDREKNIIIIRNSKYDKNRFVPCPEAVSSLLPNPDDAAAPVVDMSYNAAQCLFYRLCSVTGLSRLHPHLLRHTFATSYMINRGHLEYLRIYLGHSSYNVTQIYIKLAYQCDFSGYDVYKIDSVFK